MLHSAPWTVCVYRGFGTFGLFAACLIFKCQQLYQKQKFVHRGLDQMFKLFLAYADFLSNESPHKAVTWYMK